MADQELRSAVDRLSRQTAGAREQLAADRQAAQNTIALAAFRFAPRERALDVTSGKPVTVHSGRRSEATGRAVYVVETAAGELTHRDERELEKLTPAAPAPGR